MTTNEPAPAPLDRAGRLTLGVLAVPLFIWSLAGVVLGLRPSLVGGAEPAWMFAGFEAISAASAVCLVGLAFGKFREGPALSAASAAAAVLVGSLLGSISVNYQIGDIELRSHVLARAAAAAFIGIGTLMLAIRTTAAVIKLSIGAALVLPVIALLGLFLLGKLSGALGAFDGFHPAASLILAILAGLAALIAVSAGSHLVIAAFELQDDTQNDTKPATTASE